MAGARGRVRAMTGVKPARRKRKIDLISRGVSHRARHCEHKRAATATLPSSEQRLGSIWAAMRRPAWTDPDRDKEAATTGEDASQQPEDDGVDRNPCKFPDLLFAIAFSAMVCAMIYAAFYYQCWLSVSCLRFGLASMASGHAIDATCHIGTRAASISTMWPPRTRRAAFSRY